MLHVVAVLPGLLIRKALVVVVLLFLCEGLFICTSLVVGFTVVFASRAIPFCCTCLGVHGRHLRDGLSFWR